jgi:hypothetical protein
MDGEWMDRQKYGWMYGGMDGWMDQEKLRQILIYQEPLILILRTHLGIFSWPGFEYVSMDTFFNQEYEKSYYISSRKHKKNWCYCHHADIYSRWLFFRYL